MKKERKTIELARLQLNEGQLDWLPRNPRQWTKDAVTKTIKSLQEDPDFLEDRPVLVCPLGGDYIVFAHNLCTHCSKKIGWKELPCVVYYVETEDDRQAVIRRAIKDNGQFGDWDTDILANEWEGPISDWGVPGWVTGGAEETAGGSGSGTGSGRTAEEDDFDEDRDKDSIIVRCKPGDIWQLGEHRLMCGDSTDLETVKALMGGGC